MDVGIRLSSYMPFGAKTLDLRFACGQRFLPPRARRKDPLLACLIPVWDIS